MWRCVATFCTVIQRLGSDGLLIGSRRRVGAAPFVVGGADPVAAEVTTTAGLGDGMHALRGRFNFMSTLA